MNDIQSDELAHELAQIDKALDAFSRSMREKMHSKAIKGWRGWNNPDEKIYLRNTLQEHVSKDIRTAKQMVDVANIAMMIWFIELLEDTTLESDSSASIPINPIVDSHATQNAALKTTQHATAKGV